MIYLILQILKSLETSSIYPFEVFAAFTWTMWLPRIYFARKYKSHTPDYRTNATAVVPVLNEEPKLFRKCMESLFKSLSHGTNEFEIIVAIDGEDSPQKRRLIKIAKEFADKIITLNNKNKRMALAESIKQAKHDIIISVDSDTVFEKKTVYELLKPFQYKDIGGVTTHQRIYKPKTIVQKIADWFEDARLHSSLPAMSYFGSVGCMPGRAIAFRKRIFLKHINEFVNDWFMSRKCIIGDDRAITNYILKDGYKTIYQRTARVWTQAPETLSKWTKQQIRWGRSSQRETIRNIKWLIKKKFTSFVYITDLLLPIFFAFIVLNWAFRILMGMPIINIPLHLSIIMALVGMNLVIGIRQIPHLKNNIKDIKLLPVFTIMATYLLLIRFYALLTINKGGWLTR